MMRKLNWREIIGVRGAYGKVSDENRLINASGLNCENVILKKINWMGLLLFNSGKTKSILLDFKDNEDLIDVSFYTNDSNTMMAQASIHNGTKYEFYQYDSKNIHLQL